uniref:Large ribosomal subunit protein bL9c n=1 Tax=Caloglossa beccarii TaxID=131038 RepID=A0A1Z1M903_9FLOR|nr:ribosomal protein L9 [Caloglossa beccarii]ARW62363.1 ribosomal protein L9 [Caloglossa beccarii]
MSKKIKIILKQDYNNIGEKNNATYVNKGYALNYLIPNKIAETATENSYKHFKMLQSIERKKIENSKIRVEQLQKQINFISKLIIYKKASDNKYIFGSVTDKDIAQKITEYTNIKIEKKYINMISIKKIGIFYLDINLPYQILCKVKVHILPINI